MQGIRYVLTMWQGQVIKEVSEINTNIQG